MPEPVAQVVFVGPRRSRLSHDELEALKQAHPVQEVVAQYGVELRRQGRAFVGRCPLHADHGRPNLHVWPDVGVVVVLSVLRRRRRDSFC